MQKSDVAAAALAIAVALGTRASADDGAPWRSTSPRVRLVTDACGLELVIPSGRARGATSRAIPIAPGETYIASARLELDVLIARGAFLRVALYDRADGGGRQRVRLDSVSVRGGEAGATVLFEAPAWGHAAKLRVLARPDRGGAQLSTTTPELVRVPAATVVLRPDE